MTITAVTSYEVSLFLHITAVMVGLGSTFALAVTFPVAMSLDARHLPYVHRLSLVLSKYFATPALVVVLATGFYQVDKLGFSLGDAWLSISLALVALIAALNLGYFIPEDRKLEAMVARDLGPAGDGELSVEYESRAKREGVAGALTGLALVAIVFLMVTKLGA
jgi:uncharacterized membrane protein